MKHEELMDRTIPKKAAGVRPMRQLVYCMIDHVSTGRAPVNAPIPKVGKIGFCVPLLVLNDVTVLPPLGQEFREPIR